MRKLTSRFVMYFAYLTPSWSPDGRRIAYSIGDTLAVLDVDSGAETVPRLDSLPTGFRASAIMPRNSSPVGRPTGSGCSLSIRHQRRTAAKVEFGKSPSAAEPRARSRRCAGWHRALAGRITARLLRARLDKTVGSCGCKTLTALHAV
jgi:hypothetical protein